MKPKSCSDAESGNPRYWNPASEQCECLYQAAPVGQQFNVVKCDFECIPQECELHFYWDLDQCGCVCQEETCDAGFTWNTTKCRCECAGEPAAGCAVGELFDAGCCECKTCEVEDCDLTLEFWDPRDCSCKCLPTICLGLTVWDESSCACKVPVV